MLLQLHATQCRQKRRGPSAASGVFRAAPFGRTGRHELHHFRGGCALQPPPTHARRAKVHLHVYAFACMMCERGCMMMRVHDMRKLCGVRAR